VHPLPRAFTSPAGWLAAPNSSNFSVSVVLPARGCEMIVRLAMPYIRLLASYFAERAAALGPKSNQANCRSTDYLL